MIEGEGFTIDEKKLDYFCGKVTSNPHNESRSRSNLESLERLGVEESQGGKEKLLQIFKDGLNAPEIDVVSRPYGIVIVRKVEIIHNDTRGAIEISYFYLNGDLNSIPKVATIVIKIYKN